MPDARDGPEPKDRTCFQLAAPSVDLYKAVHGVAYRIEESMGSIWSDRT